MFVLKTEKGEFHEGGRFNIEFSQSQTTETLLFEAASPSGNVQHECFRHHLIGKPHLLSRAIDRFTDTESSGMEEQIPGAWHSSYPVMGIVTTSYCSMNPEYCA